MIFTVYGENTVTKQPLGSDTVRLALTLSLLFDNTYLCYDESLEDVGSILWMDEFSVELGDPLDSYYAQDGAYFRDFESGTVVSSPNSNVTVEFEEEHVDVTTGEVSTSFVVEGGDGGISNPRTSEGVRKQEPLTDNN